MNIFGRNRRDPVVSEDRIRATDRWIATRQNLEPVTPREALERVRFFEAMAEFHGLDVLASLLEGDKRRERAALARQDEALGLLGTWHELLAEALASERVAA